MYNRETEATASVSLLSLSLFFFVRRPNMQDYHVVVNHEKTVLRGVYMVGRYPRYMTRPEIHLMHISEDTIKYEGKPLAQVVREYAHTLADDGTWEGHRIYPRPFRAVDMPILWEELDLFNIDLAIVYNDSSIETWVRFPHHWEVSVSNFTMAVPIIN